MIIRENVEYYDTNYLMRTKKKIDKGGELKIVQEMRSWKEKSLKVN